VFRTQRRVEFRDTDAAGIAHFSVFFTMMESAEHELIRSLGLSVLGDSAVTWPRVAASCDYQSVARFEDVLDLQVSIKKLGNSSVQYLFRFSKTDAASQPTQVALGTLTAVCCQLYPGGVLKKVPIPDSIRQKMQPFLV